MTQMRFLSTLRIIKGIAYLFLVIIPSFSSGQSKATLKETIDFMKPKLAGRFYIASGYEDCAMYFDYKTNTMTYRLEGVFYGKTQLRIFTIRLKGVNFKDIAYEEVKGNVHFIRLKTNNEEPLVKLDSTYDGERTITEESSFFLRIKDKGAFEKMKEALTHAIQLCGGKGEAF